MKYSSAVTLFVTTYLVVYTVLLQLSVSAGVIYTMFAISPFLVIYMVVTILRDTSTPVKELEPGEEWGYQDKEKHSLGIF